MRYRLNSRSAKVAGFALTPVVITLFLVRGGAGDAPSAEAQTQTQTQTLDASASEAIADSTAAMPDVSFAQPPSAPADEAAQEQAPQDLFAEIQPAVAAPAPARSEAQTQTIAEPTRQAEAPARTFTEAFTPLTKSAAPTAAKAEPAATPLAAPVMAVAAVQPTVPSAPAVLPQASPAPVAAATAIQPTPEVAIMPQSLAGPASRPPAPVAETAALAAATVASAPASSSALVPTVQPQTRLALADWSYSLPAPSTPAGTSSFADTGRAAPVGGLTARPAGKQRASKAQSAQKLARPAAKVQAPSSAGKLQKYRMIGSTIEFQLPVQADGQALGQLTLHVVPDQPVSLHLKELVSLFATQLDPQLLQALNASSQIDEYVTFERLRQAGIDIRYDAAHDRIMLAADHP